MSLAILPVAERSNATREDRIRHEPSFQEDHSRLSCGQQMMLPPTEKSKPEAEDEACLFGKSQSACGQTLIHPKVPALSGKIAGISTELERWKSIRPGLHAALQFQLLNREPLAIPGIRGDECQNRRISSSAETRFSPIGARKTLQKLSKHHYTAHRSTEAVRHATTLKTMALGKICC